MQRLAIVIESDSLDGTVGLQSSKEYIPEFLVERKKERKKFD